MPIRAAAYSRLWRVLAALFAAIGAGSALVMAFALAVFETPLENPLRLLRVFLVASAAPTVVAWLLARAFAARVAVADGLLAIARRHERIEVPCDAVAAVEPWRVPLPTSGVDLRLRSGRRLHCGLALAAPSALPELIAALVRGGAPEALSAVLATPAGAYAASRPGGARWYAPLVKYLLFALVPTVPLFRLHQWVTYGGTFGEYYIYGGQAYLLGFVAYWWTFAIWLVLWSAVLRASAELAVATTARLAPSHVVRVRRWVETLRAVAYFAGVPLFLLRVALLAS